MNNNNRLYELRGNRSQREFAEQIGLSQQNYANYESGKQGLKSELIERICSTFGCNADWLLGLSEEESTLIDGGLVPPAGRRRLARPKSARPVSGAAMVAAPLRGRVHAGEATEPEVLDGLGKTAMIPQELLDADPDTYACESEGDCMDRVYPEGCIIVVSPNRQPQNGSVAVVTIDGCDAVMRRMYRTPNTLVLSPDSHNPEYTDIVISADDGHTVEFAGRVVWFQAREEMA